MGLTLVIKLTLKKVGTLVAVVSNRLSYDLPHQGRNTLLWRSLVFSLGTHVISTGGES